MADRFLIASVCVLVRGEWRDRRVVGAEEEGQGHAWNVLFIHDKPWLYDAMLYPGKLMEHPDIDEVYERRLPGTAGVGGAGLHSIPPPPRADAGLAQYEVWPGDLKACIDASGNVVVLGDGAFGEVTKAVLTGTRWAHHPAGKGHGGSTPRVVDVYLFA